jgi:hypothetical protein
LLRDRSAGLYVADAEHGFRSALKRERELNKEFKALGVMPNGLEALSTIGVMPP